MADDQPKDEEQPEVAEETKEESPDETPPEAPAEEPVEEETPEPEPEPEPEAKQPSRREQLRVQELLKKYGPPSEKPNQAKPDFRDKVQADDDVYQTLENTATEYGQQQYQQGINQATTTAWRSVLTLEDRQVRDKFPILNPHDKESFHPAVADALNQMYLRTIGYQPGDPQRGIPESVANPISYYDFVEAQMELNDEIATQRTQQTTQNIAKQTAQTGLRPSGSGAKALDLSKDPADMTTEELEAAIKATMPRDSRGRFTSK